MTMRNTIIITAILLLLIPIITNADEEQTIDQLVNDLSGDDQQSRVHARQMLPLKGVDAIPKLFPLMQHPDYAVRKAANDVIFSLINEASAPGREEQREKASDYLFQLIEPDQDVSLQMAGIKLLALVIPPEHSVKSIGYFLKDPKLRETARFALERIASKKARESLRESLRFYRQQENETEFTCALIHSLGELQDRKSVNTFASLMKDDRVEVQAAAAHALSWCGDPKHTERMWHVVENTEDDEKHHPVALDALIRFARAMGKREENGSQIVDIYKKVLELTRGAHTSAALAGLGRVGDVECVYPMLNTLLSDNTNVKFSAANALAVMGDEIVTQRLIEECKRAPFEMKIYLLAILGGRRDSQALDVIKQAAQSDEWAIRHTAMEALAELGHPDAVSVLTHERYQNKSDRAVLLDSLKRAAEVLHECEYKKAAGKAYASLLSMSNDLATQKQALEGLAACPVVEGYEVVLNAAENEDLKQACLAPLAAVANRLAEAGESEKTLTLFNKLAALKPSIETMSKLAERLNTLGVEVDTVSMLGFIKQWHLLGPFHMKEGKGWDVEYINEPEVDLDAEYSSGDGTIVWKQVQANPETGIVDIKSNLPVCDQCIAYAYTEIEVQDESDAILLLGVDDSEKIWVNGELVFQHFIARPIQVDQDRVPVKFKKGKNTILLKIYQNNLGWEFCVRVTTTQGTILPFIQTQ